jgi:hypothetical protein
MLFTKALATSIKKMLWTVLSHLLFKHTGLKLEDQIQTTLKVYRNCRSSRKMFQIAVTTELVLMIVTTRLTNPTLQKPHTQGHT